MGLTSFIQSTLQNQNFPNPKLLGKGINGILDRIPPQSINHAFLRVSSINSICPRQFVLDYWSPKGTKLFDAPSRIKMDQGTFSHWWLQNHVLGPLGILKGLWVNNTTGEVLEGYHPNPHYIYRDDPMKTPEWTLEEYTIEDTEYRIRGHIDGLISDAKLIALDSLQNFDPQTILDKIYTVEDTTFSVLEIKTVNARSFQNAKATNSFPYYYESQASIYQKLVKLDKTLALYIERDSAEIHSFWYQFQEKYWNDAKLKSKIIFTALKEKTLPDILMPCKKPTDKQATQCPHVTECFAQNLNFESYVEECIRQQPNREWLDFSDYGVPA